MKTHKHPLRHFFTNLICSLIPNQNYRRHLRVVLNSDIVGYKKFIRRDLGGGKLRIRTAIGFGARNLIIIANNKYVYKFPLRNQNSNAIALREKRIVDAFKDISPIYIPSVELLMYQDKYVRKYEYINGCHLGQISSDDFKAQMKTWTENVANFIYVLSISDPESVRDLKPADATTPHLFYGWCHNDICGNFMIDIKTQKIIAIIDWEDCKYCDFSNIFTSRHILHGAEFMAGVRDQYLKLCGVKK